MYPISLAYRAMYNLLLPYNRRGPLTIDDIMITIDNIDDFVSRIALKKCERSVFFLNMLAQEEFS